MSISELTVAESILKRRSTKRFKPDPIPVPVLERLIDLTLAAPSSYNSQPWRIILIESADQKEALAKAAWNQAQITTAPTTLIFAVDIHGWKKTFELIVQQAVDLGAWTEKTAAFFKTAVPGFQIGLGERQREYAIKDAIIAATHAALAAESMGLNSCFMNGWDENGVKEVIGAKGNNDIAIAVVLPIGYGFDIPKFSGRLPRNMTVFREKLA